MNWLFLLLLPLVLCSNPTPCGLEPLSPRQCRFIFCYPAGFSEFQGLSPRLLLRAPLTSTLPYICLNESDATGLPSGDVRLIKRTGEAFVAVAAEQNRTYARASEFGSGARPLSKRFFGVSEVEFPLMSGRSGVVRKPFKRGQAALLDDVCVVIPIQKYQLVTGVGEDAKRRVMRTTDPRDCIAYRAVIGLIIVQLTWDAADDLDLLVREPDDNPIARFKPESDTKGRLIRDNLVGSCVNGTVGREQVTYRTRATPLTGLYEVQIRHFRACGGPVNWDLQVVLDGTLVLARNGTSTGGRDSVVWDDTFTY